MIYKDLTQIHINRGFAVLIISIFLISCNGNKNHVDVSGINVNLTVKRLDKDLFQIDSSNFNTQIAAIKGNYGDFFPFYCTQVSLFGYPNSSPRFKDSIFSFLHDHNIKELHDTAESLYSDLSKQKSDIETGLKYLKYYFPKAKIPSALVTYIGGFSLGAFTYNDSVLAIGLDMYLGNKFQLYQKVPDMPQFMIRKFAPEYITPNALRVTLTGQFGFKTDGKKLIDNMIYYGKIMYILNKLLPDLPDSVTTGYSQHQLDWCKYNEGEVWKFFIGNNLLFSTNEQEYFNYVNDGPNTGGMPADAPGNLGSWVGWKIVQKYMNRFPNTTLPQLIANSNAQEILDGSHYKP